MKIKLMIALVILALAFGMVLIACDNGDLPTIKAGEKETILDQQLLGNDVGGKYVDDKGNLLSPKTNTKGNTIPSF
jgi:hypothetical protein